MKPLARNSHSSQGANFLYGRVDKRELRARLDASLNFHVHCWMKHRESDYAAIDCHRMVPRRYQLLNLQQLALLAQLEVSGQYCFHYIIVESVKVD